MIFILFLGLDSAVTKLSPLHKDSGGMSTQWQPSKFFFYLFSFISELGAGQLTNTPPSLRLRMIRRHILVCIEMWLCLPTRERGVKCRPPSSPSRTPGCFSSPVVRYLVLFKLILYLTSCEDVCPWCTQARCESHCACVHQGDTRCQIVRHTVRLRPGNDQISYCIGCDYFWIGHVYTILEIFHCDVDVTKIVSLDVHRSQ